MWMGAASDTLFLRFLDNKNPATVLGEIKIPNPSFDLMDFPIRCDRIAFSGGRSNNAGSWWVAAYAER